MLEVKHVYKNFDDKNVLNDVNFSLKKGEITALLGENGAGKSTLLRIISGYFSPVSGSVKLNDLDSVLNRLDYLKNIGYVQEVSSLYGYMTTYDFLNFMADIRGLYGKNKKTCFINIVKKFELDDVLSDNIATLSKGFKKRVDIAATLISEPEVLLLDEPTEGLDPNQKHTLRNIIKSYAKDKIVIISTHTLEDVEVMSERILLLHQGKLYKDTSMEDFKKISGENILQSFRRITNK